MLLRSCLAAAILAAGSVAQVGSPLPEKVDLEDFSQTKASSLDDFRGRALMIEFFAFW
jgi:hypothetical protein